jgi:hypothetical protein
MNDQVITGPLPDNTQHSQQTYIHAPVGFELKISTGERPQTYGIDRAATWTGTQWFSGKQKYDYWIH